MNFEKNKKHLIKEGRKQKSIKSLVIDTRLKKEVVKVDESKMKFEKKEKTPHQEVRKQRFIKALLLKKQVVKLKNDSYKCITCDKVVHNIIFHWNTYHKCIKCNKMKNTFKEHQCKNHKLKTFYKQFKDAKNASPQKEVPNNESKSSRDKTVSTQMLETKIIPVFASSQNEVYNISDSSENVCQQNEFNNNSPNNESKPSSDKTVSTQMLETKINPVFASSEYTKSDDPIEETDEWSDFIKDLKKNNKHSKLFEGMPDSPEKQNGAYSKITLTNVSNSESIPSSDETLSKKILEKRITQFLTNVQSDKSDENNTIPIPVKSKRQPRPPRKKSKKVQSKKDLNNLEDQVVDAIIIQESDLPSNGETLSEERLSNKVYDKWNVKIIEDSDFLKLYDNILQNVETSAESVITNIQTLNIKIPKNINRPLELLSDIPDSTERKKMNDYSKGEDIVIIYEQTQCEVGPSEVRRVEEEDLENLKSLRPGCCHQPKNDEIYNSPEKQNGDASNIILGIPQIKRFKNMQQKSKKKIYHVTKGEKRNVNLVEVRLEDLQKKM